MTDAEIVSQLWDAIETLWALMPPREVNVIREKMPKLYDLCLHTHHRFSHEQRMMRRAPDWSAP